MAPLKDWAFCELPTRPMAQLDLHAASLNTAQIRNWIQTRLFDLPPDSIVKLKVHGKISEEAMAVFSAPALRDLAPDTMNIEALLTERAHYRNRTKKHVKRFGSK